MNNLNRTSSIAKLAISLLASLTIVCAVSSCVDEEQFDDNPSGNLEALWKRIDEHYCFFDYKKQVYGLDWDAVHEKYAQRVNAGMTESQLFEVLSDMLSELRDGHVNLYSTVDVARYWSWKEDYPSNFSDTLSRKYLGTDYRISGSLRYRVLSDNVGYVRLASFENSLGEGNLDQMLMYLAPCNGLIIDIRDNGGGMITSAEQLSARFTNEKTLVGYMQHKTGKGHGDFSSMSEQWLKPSDGLRWQKAVVVLTNRAVYSAANEFVKYMKRCPNVIVVGDVTGGGSGMPFSSELPIGWAVRFSACPMYDADKNPTEFGIEPDHNVSLSDSDFMRGEDTIIEFARSLLRN